MTKLIELKKGDRVLLNKKHNNAKGIITFCSSGKTIMVLTERGEEFPTDKENVKLKLKPKTNEKEKRKTGSNSHTSSELKSSRREKIERSKRRREKAKVQNSDKQ